MHEKDDPEPKPPVDTGSHQAEYNGRKFFGERASDRAELTYLRDWKAWVIRTAPTLLDVLRGKRL